MEVSMDTYGWINYLLTMMSIVIPVFATLYGVQGRIKNENKEKHKPYIILDSIKSLTKLDEYRYHLAAVGRNYREKYPNYNINKIDNTDIIDVEFVLKNIGYGVASNLRFFDLLTGEMIYGAQSSNKEGNQKLFTTLDVASSEEKKVQCKIISYVENNKEIVTEDHIRLLCVYKDLNDNQYDVIISINIKENGYYDFFAYQPTSRTYNKWIKENKKAYKKILHEYMK